MSDDREAEEAAVRDHQAVPLIERLLDDGAAAGVDRVTVMDEVLGAEPESHDAWLRRLQRMVRRRNPSGH